MYDILTVAGGVLLAFFVLRVVDWIMGAPTRAAHRRHEAKMREAVEAMAADLMQSLEDSRKKTTRRKPTPKPTTKKKGAK